MKVLGNLPVVKDVNVKYPFGSNIQNETDTMEGTPVVREIYGDILMNLYKLLELTGVTPTGTEDSNLTQFQIVQSLKLLPNSLNDIEQVLVKNANVWSVPLDLQKLPNKYVFFARASENYSSINPYFFKGTGAVQYPFFSNGFSASDELMIVIDSAQVRAYSLSFTSSSVSEVYNVMGSPLRYNSSTTMYYFSDGVLYNDTPKAYNLENIIRVNVSDGTVIVVDVLISQGFALCFCLSPSTNTYFFRQFDLLDFSVSQSVAIIGETMGSLADYKPQIYIDNAIDLYITNGMNTTANNYTFSRLVYSPGTNSMEFVSNYNIGNTYVKTTNSVIKEDILYTLLDGQLTGCNLAGTRVFYNIGVINTMLGVLFGHRNNVYYSSNNIAKKWF